LAIKNILYKGISPEVALKSLGNAEKRLMKEIMEIKLFTNPNNALSTIRRKGRDDALVETGLLKKSIKVWVGPKEAESGED